MTLVILIGNELLYHMLQFEPLLLGHPIWLINKSTTPSINFFYRLHLDYYKRYCFSVLYVTHY